MSEPNLRLLPEELRAAAGNLGALSDNTSQSQQILSRAWARLDAGWDTYAEADINSYYNEAMNEVSRMVAMLAQMGEALGKTTDLIQAADQTNATRFGEQNSNPAPPAATPPGLPGLELPVSAPPFFELGYTTPLPGSMTLTLDPVFSPILLDPNAPPLPPELWEYAQQAAAEFGVPPELVAAVLAAEQQHDYTFQDTVEDHMAGTALILIEAAEANREAGWPAPDSSWQGWLILGLIEQLDLSLGVGQVRLSTAQGVADYVAGYPDLGLSDQYPQGLEVQDLVARLEDPQWNARYVAGYLRQLMDMRANLEASGAVSSNISDVERMQIIYWAYRAGPGALGNESPYVDADPNTPAYDPAPGLDLSPEVIQYYQDLLDNQP
jgi:uncharacterized protein YukE